jgi:hypothetical protein
MDIGHQGPGGGQFLKEGDGFRIHDLSQRMILLDDDHDVIRYGKRRLGEKSGGRKEYLDPDQDNSYEADQRSKPRPVTPEVR